MDKKDLLQFLIEKHITPTNIRTVQMLADNYTREDIAKQLKKSRRTIEQRITKMKELFNCKKEAGLVAFFFRNNLIK